MKTRKTITLMLALLMVLAALPWQQAAAADPDTFNVNDIAAINNIIVVNGWGAPQAPADGSSVPGEWNGKVFWTDNATNKRVKELTLISAGLTGTLDVSGLTALTRLDCRGNQLTGLNVDSLSSLQELFCSSNQLTALNVSGLTALFCLNCSDNQLTALNVNGLTALQRLYCERNQLTGLALDQGAPYQYIHAGYNYLADEGAVTGRTINWDEVNYCFIPQYRRVSYDANGGSGQMQTHNVTDGEPFKLLANGFTAPSGQRFKAWAIGDVSGPQKKAGEQHTFNADTTLYAIWYYPVTGVTLSKTYIVLAVGGAETLYATVAPPNATDPSVTWSSSNTGIAAVDQSGKVTAVAPGTAGITVKTADGEKTATCAVNVDVPVTGVELNKTATTLVVGGSETLTATIVPPDALYKAVTWSSDKPGVASVDQNGKVTAVAPGAATITVKTEDGGKTASCSVTVRQAAPFTGAVTFDKNTVKTGEPVTATWNLSGGTPPYSVSAYSWYVREEGSGTRILEKSGGAAAVGSLSFTPTKGEALMLELDLRDSADQIFQYSSDWIPISGGGSPDTAVKGDANGDNSIDIRDLVSIINYIVSGIQPKSTEGADANGDGDVDIRDLVWVINVIVG
ncbi:MAG: Ig-like domain-containing protein [Christensenellales bacterium]